MREKLKPEALRNQVQSKEVKCKSSEQVEPLKAIIGQERAVKALEFGLGIQGQGFNIFISGNPGTGKTSAAMRYLNKVAQDQAVPNDWVYVNNFNDNYRPMAISFNPGEAKEFRDEIHELFDAMDDNIKQAFDSEDYARQKDAIAHKYQEKKDELFKEINEYAQENNFAIQQTSKGFETVPLNSEGNPIQNQEFQNLSKEEREKLEDKGKKIQKDLKNTLRKIQRIEKDQYSEVQNLDKEVARYAIQYRIDDLKEKYEQNSKVLNYLDDILKEIINNLSYFRKTDQEQENKDPYHAMREERFMKQFRVNVLIDNTNLEKAPVVMEHNPTYNNLFGKIEKESQFGALETDFTLIRQGSLQQANGGYIIIPVEDLFRHPFSWENLIHALKNQEITIEDITEKLGYMNTKTLKPDPIPMNLKVILIGQPMHYHALYNNMDDFRKLFKVKSDFDSSMERSDKNIDDYVAFICKICNEDASLKHLDNSGLTKMVEYSSRLADHQHKLSTRFREISDIIKEANYYAGQNGADYIQSDHLITAIEEKTYRSNLIQEKINEMIREGTLIIDVTGSKTGEINGLSVLDLGDISFGRPNKITTSLSLGKGNLLDIEREVKMGGPIHSKGVLILSGYLMDKYALERPMNLSVRLVFEQNYSGIDGDSASSAEAYATLSEIGDLPIKQNIAVTGSINQKGQIQPIGGVNEKIEGFYEVCKQNGLTGDQGVIIPELNVKNLMLKEEVVEATKKGDFHVWPVSTIDEGFEILSGKKAGTLGENGQYEEGSFNAIINHKLTEYNQRWQKFHNNDAQNQEQ